MRQKMIVGTRPKSAICTLRWNTADRVESVRTITLTIILAAPCSTVAPSTMRAPSEIASTPGRITTSTPTIPSPIAVHL